MFKPVIGLVAAMSIAAPAVAATPRDILTAAAFSTRDKATALAQVGQAEAGAVATLARSPNDREAQLIRAMAVGYRAKLNKSRADALTARKLFDAYAAANPRDPEAQAMVGGWHVDAVAALGGMIAGAALGAKRATGLAALDRSVALGGNRAMFPALDGLLRLTLDGADPRAAQLADAATRATVQTALDRILQRSAAQVLVPLRAGDTKGAQRLARQLLPFGRITG